MRIRWSTLGLVLGAAAIGGAGFLAGRLGRGRAPDAAAFFRAVARDTARKSDEPRGKSAPAVAPAVAAMHTAGKAPPTWQARWQELQDRPASPDRDAALALALEELAASEPMRAVQIARAEGNLRLRDALLQASLRGWAGAEPEVAITWTLANLAGEERERAIASVLTGAARRPDDALRIGQRLCEAVPALARERGSALLAGLMQRGEFAAAMQFAASGGPELRTNWLGTVFSNWAQYQPEVAARVALQWPDDATRPEVLHALIVGWAPADPVNLAKFAMEKLADPSTRTYAVGEALRQWVSLNPGEASQWIDRFDSSADFDVGAAALATMPKLGETRPDVAFGWAESIAEPNLRYATLRTVVSGWAARDPAAARRQVEKSTELRNAERDRLINMLENPYASDGPPVDEVN